MCMSKNKKSSIKHQRGIRNAREQEARERFNELMRAMRRMAGACGCIEIYDKYIAPRREEIRGCHYHTLRIDPDPSCEIDSGLLTQIRKDFSDLFKDYAFYRESDKVKISFGELLTAGMTLHLEALLLKIVML